MTLFFAATFDIEGQLQILSYRNWYISIFREKDADICNNLTKENLLKQEKNIESNNTEILNRLFIKQDSIGGLQNTSESQNQVLARVQAFLHDLTHQYPSTAKVLVVGSPIVNSYLITLLL